MMTRSVGRVRAIVAVVTGRITLNLGHKLSNNASVPLRVMPLTVLGYFIVMTLIGCTRPVSSVMGLAAQDRTHNSEGSNLLSLEYNGTSDEHARVQVLLQKLRDLRPLSASECQDIPLLANLNERPISKDVAETIARYQHFYGNGLFKAKHSLDRLDGQMDFASIFRDYALHAIYLAWNDAPTFLRDSNNRISHIEATETLTMAETFDLLGAMYDDDNVPIRLDLIARPAAYEALWTKKLNDVRLLDPSARMIAPAILYKQLDKHYKELSQDSAKTLTERLNRLTAALRELHAVEIAAGRQAAKNRCLEILADRAQGWKSFEQFIGISEVATTKAILKLNGEMERRRDKQSSDPRRKDSDKILADIERIKEETRRYNEGDGDGKPQATSSTESSVADEAFFLSGSHGFTPLVKFSGTQFGRSTTKYLLTDHEKLRVHDRIDMPYATDENAIDALDAKHLALQLCVLNRTPLTTAEQQRSQLSNKFWEYDVAYHNDNNFLFDDLSFPVGVRRKDGFCKKCGGDGDRIITKVGERPVFGKRLARSFYDTNTGGWVHEYVDVQTGSERIEKRERVGCPFCATGYDLKTSHLYQRPNRVDQVYETIDGIALWLSRTRFPVKKCSVADAVGEFEQRSRLPVYGITAVAGEVDFPSLCGNRYSSAMEVLNVIERQTGRPFVIGAHSVNFFEPGATVPINPSSRMIYERKRRLGGGSDFTAVALSTDGRVAVTLSRTVASEVWDPEKAAAVEIDPKRPPRQVVVWDVESGVQTQVLSRQFGQVETLALSGDSNRVLATTGENSDTAVVWDLKTGKVLTSFQSSGQHWSYAAMNENGSRALLGSYGNASFWDVDSGKQLKSFGGYPDDSVAVALSSDGHVALTASVAAKHGRVTLWDTMSGEMRTVLDGHQGGVYCLKLSQDGRHALTGSEDNRAIYWDTLTGEKVQVFTGHRSWIRGVALSSDGRHAVTCANDQTVIVWDLQTGERLQTLTGHWDPVFNVAISRNGQRILAGSTEAIVWESVER